MKKVAVMISVALIALVAFIAQADYTPMSAENSAGASPRSLA